MFYRVAYNEKMDPVVVRRWWKTSGKEQIILKSSCFDRGQNTIVLVKQFESKVINVEDCRTDARGLGLTPIQVFDQRVRKRSRHVEDFFTVAAKVGHNRTVD